MGCSISLDWIKNNHAWFNRKIQHNMLLKTPPPFATLTHTHTHTLSPNPMLPHAISCTKSKLHFPPDRQSVNLVPFVKKPHYTPPRTHWMRPKSGFYEKRWDQRILVFASNNHFNQVHETGYSSLGERVSSMEQHLPRAWYPPVEIKIHIGHVAFSVKGDWIVFW